MKNQSPLQQPTDSNSLLSPKTRVALVIGSLIAFGLALLLYFMLGVNGEGKLIAGNQVPLLPGEPLLAQPEYPHVPGRLLIRIQPEHRAACGATDIQISSLKAQFQKFGISAIRKNFPQAEPIVGEQRNDLGQQLVDLSLIYELEFDSATAVLEVVEVLEQDPAVMYAEPRYIYDVMLSTNDIYTSYQWYLDTMHVREAWDHTTGDTNVVIAIIDTGTDFNHEELDNDRVSYNLADPVDGLDNDNDGYIDNYKGWDFGGTSFWAPADNNPNYVGSGPGMDHGVLVAGVACAEANNGKGIAGAGYHTRYLPLKASVDASLGISYGFDAIAYAADHDADIINLSWGSGAFSSVGQNVVNYAAINKQCLLVAASGNNYANTFVYPASYDHVMSTAATQIGDVAWDNANGTGTTYNYLVDICAPGRSMISTTGGGGVWSGATGTSMSAPVVCALAALVRAKYPNLDNVQAGEMVRSTAVNIYPNNPPVLNERIGKGRADALQAVTQTNVKSVRLDTMMIQDGLNNIAEPFDTLDISAKFINYLAPTQNLEVNISSPNSEFVDIIQGSSSIGAVGTRASASTPSPLRIYLKKPISTPTKIWLRFGFSDGAYSDYQYHELIIYPNMIDLDANQTQTTINGTGNFGYVDYPGFQYGLGYQYNTNGALVRDAGFMVGISANKVVDMVRNDLAQRETDFAPVEKPYRVAPGVHADLEAHARFADLDAYSQTIGLNISQNAYQYAGGGQDQYIIFEYVIRNTNNYPINDAYAGLYAQWNRAAYNLSNAQFLPGANAVAVEFSALPSNFYSGMALLTQQQVNAHVTTESQFNFSGQAKFDALRSPAASQNLTSGDVVEFVSAGPFNLAGGDSIIVAFALLSAPDVPTFEVVAMNAKAQYNCEILDQKPIVDLGSDVSSCGPASPPTFDAGSGQGWTYLWNTGATSQTISPTNAGQYAVTVYNEFGCTGIDSISLTLRSLDNFTINSPNSTFNTSAPIDFLVNDPANEILSYTWDFGDGATSNLAAPNHTYAQAGTYTVTVVIDNGVCSATLSYPLTVSTVTSVQNGADQAVKFYPNPVQDQLQFRMEYDFNGPVTVELYDNAGKLALRKTMEKTGFSLEQTLDVSELAKGLYIVKSRAGKLEFSDKILKQ